MAKRRTHSSIDRLPASLKETVTAMVVDNIWPDDYNKPDDHEGNPRYEDIVDYCKRKGHPVSASAVGRWALSVRTLARMKQAGQISRDIMANLDNEKASQTQKAVAEMITAVAIEFVGSNDELSARQIKDVANAIRDCTNIAIKSDEYVRTQVEKKAAAADEKITELAGQKKIDKETLQMIREQVYGIVS